MTDQPQPQTSTDDKNPLDVLEEILKDAKSKGGAGNAPSGPSAEELAAQEEARQLAEAEQVMSEKKKDDEEKLKLQIQELQTITDTPENQARVEQIEEKKQQEANQKVADEGFEIEQLGHSKV